MHCVKTLHLSSSKLFCYRRLAFSVVGGVLGTPLMEGSSLIGILGPCWSMESAC